MQVEDLVNVMAAPWELHHLEYLCLDEDPDLVSKLLGYNSIAIVEKKGRLGNHVSLVLGVFPGLRISLVSVILMAVVVLRSPWTMLMMLMMTIIMMLILRITSQHVVGCSLSKLSAGMVRGIIGSIM